MHIQLYQGRLKTKAEQPCTSLSSGLAWAGLSGSSDSSGLTDTPSDRCTGPHSSHEKQSAGTSSPLEKQPFPEVREARGLIANVLTVGVSLAVFPPVHYKQPVPGGPGPTLKSIVEATDIQILR